RLEIQIWAEGDRLRYRVPNGTLSEDVRAMLAERKADILAFLRAAQASACDTEPPIARLDADRPLALSFGQRRLWFLDQLEPGNPQYNMPFALRLEGPLDAGALERSLNEIARRHAILRTTFAIVDGQPVQAIAPSLTVPLPSTDLRDISGPEREARVL